MAGTAVLLVDADFTVRWATRSVRAVLGYGPELIGSFALDLVHPDDQRFVADVLASHVEDPAFNATPPDEEGVTPIGAAVRIRTASGTFERILANVTNELDKPDIGAVVVTLRRARDQSHLTEALALLGTEAPVTDVLHALLGHLRVEATRAGLVIAWDDFDGARHVSLGLAPGIAPLLADVRPFADLFEGGHSAVSCTTEEIAEFAPELAGIAADAGYRMVWLVPLRSLTGARLGIVVVWTAASYRLDLRPDMHLTTCVQVATLALLDHQRRQRYRIASSTDPLTGLANRAALQQFIDDAQCDSLDRTSDSAGRWPLAALFADLDDFKPVNDRYGHEAGDDALVEIASRLLAAIRPDDLAVRVGGDEFVILCGGADAATAELLSSRIVDAISRPFVRNGIRITLSASVGFSLARDASELVTALGRADDALREAKRCGKNRTVGEIRAA
jgi:diguanylate cyclase (GGDEF)-like protein